MENRDEIDSAKRSIVTYLKEKGGKAQNIQMQFDVRDAGGYRPQVYSAALQELLLEEVIDSNGLDFEIV